ncbi:MAG: SRPBCC family protein [Planctomycetaceae bacterium]|nr:SRPBCC family protein [Planctomycetaceae bacterium]
MMTLLRREFTADVSLEQAWQHLARVERWPSWAKHIKQIDVQPLGELGPTSTGLIRLTNGIKSAFSMTEFNPGRNWKWVGGFLWLRIHYDHRFETVNPQQTKLIWIIEGDGFGVSVFGKLFAKIYNQNLTTAIPALIAEMNAGNGRPG